MPGEEQDDVAGGAEIEDYLLAGPLMPIPDWEVGWFRDTDTDVVTDTTRACFQGVFGAALSGFPSTNCERPLVNLASCTVPDIGARLEIGRLVSESEWASYLIDEIEGALAIVDPSLPDVDDLRLFRAAVALLQQNLDLVSWVLCLTRRWSPEVGRSLQTCIEDMLTPNADGTEMIRPWHVTWVGRERDDIWNPVQVGPFGMFPMPGVHLIVAGGAWMWAFTDVVQAPDGTVGLVVPIEHPHWIRKKEQYQDGGDAAFCAAVTIAATILHELVHICGDIQPAGVVDETGATHDESGCWDEPAMAEGSFGWAMAQRFPCALLRYECERLGDDGYFATSESRAGQLARGG